MMRRVKVTGKKKSMTGDVVYENDCCITVQGPHYRECFLRVDFKIGYYKIQDLEGN